MSVPNPPPDGRIEQTFARLKAEGRTGLVAFLTVGYPDVEATLGLVPALVEGGADIIELGMPFSDPLAEGPTIQHSSYARAPAGRHHDDVPGGDRPSCEHAA